MLIEKPHALCSIHGGASSESDNRIWLEGIHQLYAPSYCLDIWIRLHITEKLDGNWISSQAQLLCYFVHEAELHHGPVGDDEHLIDVSACLEILDGVSLKVYFLWDLEPLHGISPLSYLLHVEKVYCGYVTADTVPSVGSTAQSQGWKEGVVDVADSSKGRWGIPDDSHGLHLLSIGVCHSLLLAVDGCRVAESIELNHFSCLLEAFLVIFHLENSKDRRKLLSGDWLLWSDFLTWNTDYGCVFWNLETCLLCNPVCTLSHESWLEAGILHVLISYSLAEHVAGKLDLLLLGDEVGLESLEERHCIAVHILVNDYSLLGSADHTVVEGL